MTSEEKSIWEKLQRRYPWLEFVDKGAKIKCSWLRYQAHHIVNELVDLPAIGGVCGPFRQTVPIRNVVAFGSDVREVGKLLANA